MGVRDEAWRKVVRWDSGHGHVDRLSNEVRVDRQGDGDRFGPVWRHRLTAACLERRLAQVVRDALGVGGRRFR